MRDSSWALGKSAQIRREIIDIGPFMAARDREAKADVVRGATNYAFKGFTTDIWGIRNLDNVDNQRVFDGDPRRFRNTQHKRHGE